jgi:hypothetical protein
MSLFRMSSEQETHEATLGYSRFHSSNTQMEGVRQVTLEKAKMIALIQEQPDDATYEEIMRELAFQRMVDRGLEDVRTGKTISNEEMAHRIRTWAK